MTNGYESGGSFPSEEDWHELWDEMEKDRSYGEISPSSADAPYVPDYDALLDDTSVAGYSI